MDAHSLHVHTLCGIGGVRCSCCNARRRGGLSRGARRRAARDRNTRNTRRRANRLAFEV